MRNLALIPLALLIAPTAFAVEGESQGQDKAIENVKINNAFGDFVTGLDYYNGWGDSGQNYGQALIYFENAARAGHEQSLQYLGLIYYKGLGVQKDNIEAYKWFDLAASSGDKVGIVLKLTLKDLLTPQDLKEAEERKEEWLHSAHVN